MSQAKAAALELASNSILTRAKALGNHKKGLKEVASDLLNRGGRKSKREMQDILDGTFLCRATILKVMDCPDGYRPQADTLERIFKYFGAEITFSEVHIQPRFQNQPKE